MSVAHFAERAEHARVTRLSTVSSSLLSPLLSFADHSTHRTAVVAAASSDASLLETEYTAYCAARAKEWAAKEIMDEAQITEANTAEIATWGKLDVWKFLQGLGVAVLSGPLLHAVTLLGLNGREFELFQNWPQAFARYKLEAPFREAAIIPTRWTSNLETEIKKKIKQLREEAQIRKQQAVELAKAEQARNEKSLNITIKPSDIDRDSRTKQPLGSGHYGSCFKIKYKRHDAAMKVRNTRMRAQRDIRYCTGCACAHLLVTDGSLVQELHNGNGKVSQTRAHTLFRFLCDCTVPLYSSLRI